MRLNGKISIITGAANGIGKATALKFSAEGATVVVCDLNLEAVAGVVEEIKAAGGKADILILGSYGREAVSGTKGKKSEQLTISGKIYSLRHRKVLAEYSRKAAVDARIFTTVNDIAQEAVHSIQAYTRKINEDQTVVDPKTGKEALTLERLKLKVFVPPMF